METSSTGTPTPTCWSPGLRAEAPQREGGGLFDRVGGFVPAETAPDDATIERLFRGKVLRLLRDEGAIDDKIVENLLSWKHTGFSAYVGKQLPGTDRVALEAVAQYLVHPPVVLGRILSEGTAEKIVYEADAVHPRHGGNFRVFDPLDFIPLRSRLRASFGGQVAQVVCHITDAHEKSRLFYGFCSARARGWRRRQGVVTGAASAGPAAAEVDESDRAPLSVRRRWAELIKKVGACPERAKRVEGGWIPWSVPAAARR